jgi:hypothetical protein
VSSSKTAMTEIGAKTGFDWQAFLSQMVPNKNSQKTSFCSMYLCLDVFKMMVENAFSMVLCLSV